MNFSSFISSLKNYVLMTGVILVSLVLIVVFLVQKYKGDSDTKPSAQISASTEAAQNNNNAVQPATFALDGNTPPAAQSQPVAAGTDAVMTDENGMISTDITTSTEPVPVQNRSFQTVDDSYFHDALFIGNSRTVGLSLFGSMPSETTFYATVGMNIYDLLDSSAQIPPEEGPEQSFSSLINGTQFGKIYIMLGINDLGTGTSESFAEYYKNIVDTIHTAQPNAIIYIQSIINISAARDSQGDCINNASINEKNALLEKLANNDYIYYLNVNENLVDAYGYLNSDYTSDGIHLGGGSLSIWEDYLYTHAIIK